MLVASLIALGACPYSGRRLQQEDNVREITNAMLAGTPIAHRPGIYEGQAVFPHDVLTCPTSAAATTLAMTAADYDDIAAAVIASKNALPATCTPDDCPRADFVGCVVRFIGHDLMDFRITDRASYAAGAGGASTGGVDGCVSFDDPDNRGLGVCLSSLQTSFSLFCSRISLADFAVVAAEALMADVSESPATLQTMFRSDFMYGRTTAASCPSGLMPNPEDSCSGLSSVFVDHVFAGTPSTVSTRRSTRCAGRVCGMWEVQSSGEYSGHEDETAYHFGRGGLDRRWMLTAAISGAHTLGRAFPANSGYFGWWSDHLESAKFNNDYFKALLFKGWRPETALFGDPSINMWLRADNLGDRQDVSAHTEMMLDTDMCLAYSRDGSELVARDGTCCAWVRGGLASSNLFDSTQIDDFCGAQLGANQDPGGQRGRCCTNNLNGRIGNDCDRISPNPNNPPRGVAYDAVERFAKNELAFLYGFLEAWHIATTNGHTGQLHFLVQPTATPSADPASCNVATSAAVCEASGCHWSDSTTVTVPSLDGATVSSGPQCVAGTQLSWGTVWGDIHGAAASTFVTAPSSPPLPPKQPSTSPPSLSPPPSEDDDENDLPPPSERPPRRGKGRGGRGGGGQRRFGTNYSYTYSYDAAGIDGTNKSEGSLELIWTNRSQASGALLIEDFFGSHGLIVVALLITTLVVIFLLGCLLVLLWCFRRKWHTAVKGATTTRSWASVAENSDKVSITLDKKWSPAPPIYSAP